MNKSDIADSGVRNRVSDIWGQLLNHWGQTSGLSHLGSVIWRQAGTHHSEALDIALRVMHTISWGMHMDNFVELKEYCRMMRLKVGYVNK